MLITLGLVVLTQALGAALPEGGQIAYVSGKDGDLDIYLRDLARGLTFNLTRTPENETQPDWSPDGSQIVFSLSRQDNIDLYILQVNCPDFFSTCSVPLRRLTSEFGGDTDPAWSPDGSQIVYMSDEFGNNEIMVIDVTGNVVQRLTDNERLDANPAWSPDGSQIVFSSDRDTQWNTDLYLMDANGNNVRSMQQTPDNEFLAAWSPDGLRLAFGSSKPTSYQLTILDTDSGTITPLLDDQGYDDTPSWSPDGETLALSSIRAGDYEIYTLRLDCEGIPADCLHRLTFNPALDTMPVWRP
jgi:Tol biopolymer transport system component